MTLKKLALFDLDHTLIPFDSDYSWGSFTTELGWTHPVSFQQQNDAFYAQYKNGTLDIHAYVRFATAALRQQGSANALAARDAYMRKVVLPGLLPQARQIIGQHQEEGATVVIITATNEFVTRPIADALGVEELLAIELERQAQPGQEDWYTGEIKGVPTFREGKVLRMQAWLAQRGWDWDHVHTTFYSDSINDLPLLERVNAPIATNPDDALRAIAQARGWPILSLFAS
jgi:HAD superfamily hydrolase (TIGR01490 family)